MCVAVHGHIERNSVEDSHCDVEEDQALVALSVVCLEHPHVIVVVAA